MTKDYFQYNPKKKIAFDIGNVLFHFDLSPLLDLLVGLNIVENNAQAYDFMGGSFQHSQEIGLYDIKQSFYQLNPKLSSDTLQEIYDRWMETFEPSLPMIENVQAYRSLLKWQTTHYSSYIHQEPTLHKC